MSNATDLSVQDAYDRWAKSYDAYDNPMVFTARHALSQQDWQDVSVLVELGCGTGQNLLLAERAGVPFRIGLDLSAGMLKTAQEQGSNDSYLLQSDITKAIPLKSDCADTVLFSLALEHAASLERPFHEAARLLKPNGSLTVIEIHPYFAEQGGKAHFWDGEAEYIMSTYAHRFSDYIGAAEKAELALSSCKEWTPQLMIETGLSPETLPQKVTKRGDQWPIAVEFHFARL